jgi:carboxylesterase type B
MASSNSSTRSSTAFPGMAQGGLSGKRTGTTCEYLGVPYGAPPTGALRFMPPTPAAG